LDLRSRYIASRDGTRLRVATWDAAADVPARGVCAILDGQTEFLEKYTEVIGELSARGFAGAILDWRGQGGSARLLDNPLKAHVRDFADYDLDLAAFLEQIVTPLDPAPPLALAHSMGGHILLRTLHTRPNAFRAAVMTAPLLQPSTRGYPGWLVRTICQAHVLAGLGEDWVWGMRGRDPLSMTFDDNRVTSDRARFARARALLTGQSELVLSGPTWGWLEAAYRSMAEVAKPGFAEAITTPCLIFGAGRDRIVETDPIRAFARRLAHGTYEEIGDAEHEILMENDTVRARFWAAFDAFVERLARATAPAGAQVS
jgi:lysophospholipase